ncbi:hypothetical protein GGR53DRAFT_465080 [Hypoxylon sp. FL1150]|nr:hypothetical protein GGR53DRAFT_465080 [Hypoxylon sp. FL1150]
MAASKWNEGDIGVLFRRVADSRPAVFQLAYKGEIESLPLATAFFPYRARQKRQPTMYIYEIAFTTSYHEMFSLFCHELGHMLGLRHEFAQTDPIEQRMHSVLIGVKNERSIMNHLSAEIQESDYAGVRELYALEGKRYGGFKIRNVFPKEFVPPPIGLCW